MTNSLLDYYRKPQVYCMLPSQGKFYFDGIKLGIDGQLAVKAMTANDELMLKNPEALINGEAILNLISSCCPDIKNPAEVPIIDLDVILISIRHATYGENLEFTSTCPKCKEKNSLELNIGNFLDNITFIETYPFFHVNEEIKCFVKPFSYVDSQKIEIAEFEYQSVLRNLDNQNLNKSLNANQQEIKEKRDNFIKTQLTMIANCIYKVELPNETVHDRANINDFVYQLDKLNYNKLNDLIKKLNVNTVKKKFKLKCPTPECGEEFEQEVDFNNSNFFEKGF